MLPFNQILFDIEQIFHKIPLFVLVVLIIDNGLQNGDLSYGDLSRTIWRWFLTSTLNTTRYMGPRVRDMAGKCSKPLTRRYAHSEGATHYCYDSKPPSLLSLQKNIKKPPSYLRLHVTVMSASLTAWRGTASTYQPAATRSRTAVACYRRGDKDYAAVDVR